MDNAIRIDIGCGDKCKEGFLGVDIRKFPGVEYVCNAWELDKHLEPSSVSEITSRHFFEHLTFSQADKTLDVFYKILKPGGIVNIIVPDMEYHCNQLLNSNIQEPSDTFPSVSGVQHAICSFYGWQNESNQGNTWDIHKSGYNFELLKMKLETFGFASVQRIEDTGFNLNVKALKTENSSATSYFFNNFFLRGYEKSLLELDVVKNRINSFKSDNKNKKILFYGAGSCAETIIRMADFSEMDVIGFVDSDINKSGSMLSGYKIYHLNDIKQLNPDILLITILDSYPSRIEQQVCEFVKENNLDIEVKQIYKSSV